MARASLINGSLVFVGNAIGSTQYLCVLRVFIEMKQSVGTGLYTGYVVNILSGERY